MTVKLASLFKLGLSIKKSMLIQRRPTMPAPNDNWDAYSKLVLKELETLATNVSDLKSHLSNIEKEIAEIKARESRVKDLESWKDRIDEIVSPTQLKEMQDEVKELKLYKTKAMTIFTVAQFLWAIAFAMFQDIL